MAKWIPICEKTPPLNTWILAHCPQHFKEENVTALVGIVREQMCYTDGSNKNKFFIHNPSCNCCYFGGRELEQIMTHWMLLPLEPEEPLQERHGTEHEDSKLHSDGVLDNLTLLEKSTKSETKATKKISNKSKLKRSPSNVVLTISDSVRRRHDMSANPSEAMEDAASIT